MDSSVPRFVYAILPQFNGEPLPFIKIGRWSGSIKRLEDRYKTYYVSFEMTVFQCEDNVANEKHLFASLRDLRCTRELYMAEAYPLFLEHAATKSFESVTHYDLLEAWKIRDVKLAQKEELAAIRSRAIRPNKRKAPPLTHNEKIALLLKQQDEKETERQAKLASKAEKNKKLDPHIVRLQVRDFLHDFTNVGIATGKNCDVISGKTLFQLFNEKVSFHAAKKDRILYKHFLSHVEELWNTTVYKDKTITRDTHDGPKVTKYHGVLVGHSLKDSWETS